MAKANTISDSLLEVRGLKTHFFTEEGVVQAVDGVDFTLKRGQVLGLVGELGCGKSVTSLSILRLIMPPGRIVTGEILFNGEDLLKLGEAEMDKIRGNKISMIFQQPQSCLNPVFSIGSQVAETFEIHTDMGKTKAWEKALDLFKMVGMPDYKKKASSYPHEISGGQAQRAMIAMMLAMSPEILIADEPTTALDVTIQAQILNLIRDLRSRLGTAVILITHDLGVVAEMADRVAVMYAGEIVEQSNVKTLFKDPQHPYTLGLIGAIPVPGRKDRKLEVIPGAVPNLLDLPPGCRFAPRCRMRMEHNMTICDQLRPDLIDTDPDHTVRCWLYQNTPEHKAPLHKEVRA